MGQFREITREVTIPARVAAVNGEVRVWDAPCGSPIKNITIAVSNGRTNLVTGVNDAASLIATTAAIANLTHETVYGGIWDGAPFNTASTHSGGVSQGAAAAFTVGTEIAQLVHEDTSILPTNVVGPNVQHDMKNYGLPIVLELVNTNLFTVTLFVTFISESLATNV